MTRKKSVRRTSKQRRTNLPRWVIFGALAVALSFFTYFAIRNSNSGNTARLSLTNNTPTPVEFADTNTTIPVAGTNIPDINNTRTSSPILPLRISFDWTGGEYADAFKMNLTAKDLAENIKITPYMRGTWRLYGNSTATFTPDADWPADTKFTVRINSAILNSDAEFDRRRFSFTTAAPTATVDSFNIYPTANKQVVGAAVISFNYPVNTTDFANRVSLKLDNQKIDFTVRFDRFHRTAIISSAPVEISSVAQIMRLKINRTPVADGDAKTKKLTAHATVESADNIFKISSLDTSVADDSQNQIRQLIMLDMTAAAAPKTDWTKYIHAYLLPRHMDANADTDTPPHEWANDEITPDVIKKSTKLKLTPTDFVTPNGVYQYAFEYSVADHDARYIYVTIDSGIQSAGGFTLNNGLSRVLTVTYPEQSVEIAGSGALLSLAGDQKLSLMARGGADAAYINLYKVKSDEINHLITQTFDAFAQNIDFKSWSFGVYDMASVFNKKISFADTNPARINYASLDLGDYLDRTGADKTGIFIIQAAPSETDVKYSDRRMILLTDLGLIHKANADGSSTLFVSTLSDGAPAADVEVEILGRNGNAIWAGRTDGDGTANMPAFAHDEYQGAREPVAIVARRDNDVSFIPYQSYNQRTDYSKFDTDGVFASTATPLNAFIFSDRGIYRPGEDIIIGGIVKNKTFKSLSGIPVKMELRDARGRIVLERTFSLASDGMFDIKYNVSSAAPVGTWQATLYSLTPKNKIQHTLGTAEISVSEFIPDTMKITATIAGATDNGWIAPENLTANVSLRNLFGTPAAARRITAHAVLTPTEFSFPEFSGYTFTPNFITGALAENAARRTQTFTTNIDDVTTDENGNAALDIKFEEQIPSGTYVMRLNVSGFESGSGRNVQTNITSRVSDSKYLVGFRASGDLAFINRASDRTINLIAVDHTGNQTAADGITMKLIQRENLTSLVKDYNNFYKYQTVTRDRVMRTDTISISATGTDITLPTDTHGTYFVQLFDASNRMLANIEYFVASDENSALSTDTDAELQVKLNASEFNAGTDITMNITAPYQGTGLITIERDRVYAYKWFRATSASSRQTIKIPSDFTGTGYVNVSFVRDINSPDVFTTPYAYAVVPFTANIDAHRINIELNTPEKITDSKLTVKYKTSQDSRVMIFAVNTGILQVAKYEIPNPLAHFFKKSALQVDTFQTLSLLLPEYKILREFAKTGGSDYAMGADGINQILTNPFARRTLPAVAFYSNILDARANTESDITFDIPDYFNGNIRVFAVAASNNAVGAADTDTTIQSPVMISTNAPLFAAPGDKFDINTVVTNLTGNTENTTATVNVTASKNLTLTSATDSTISVADGAENLTTFSVTASDTLGNADIDVTATIGDNVRAHRTSMSVRPITTYETRMMTKVLDRRNTRIRGFFNDTYPEFSNQQISISSDASAYTRPLVTYLDKYDFTCTEQITSRGIAYVLTHNDAFIPDTGDKITNIINTLKNRQNDDGSFALWLTGGTPRDNASNADAATLTTYVTQFLTLARKNGFIVPDQMINNALSYLRTYAAQNITSADNANAAAFAIYVITQNDFVTTGYIDIFQEYAKENLDNWESGISGAYIAAAYKMLHQDDMAEKLIRQYRTSSSARFDYESMFRNNIADDAAYYYIKNRYFNANINDALTSNVIREYINAGNFSAYTSAAVVMALSATDTPNTLPALRVLADDVAITPTKNTQTTFTATIPFGTKTITIECDNCDKSNAPFVTVLQQGFPRAARADKNGLDISREYYDIDGNRITSGNIGDTVNVRVSVRTRGMTSMADGAVITDLLPAGMTVNEDSFKGDATFYEIREDRVLIFTDITRETKTFEYSVTLSAAGTFTAPGVSAKSMYNPAINASDIATTFTVSNDTGN